MLTCVIDLDAETSEMRQHSIPMPLSELVVPLLVAIWSVVHCVAKNGAEDRPLVKRPACVGQFNIEGVFAVQDGYALAVYLLACSDELTGSFDAGCGKGGVAEEDAVDFIADFAG